MRSNEYPAPRFDFLNTLPSRLGSFANKAWLHVDINSLSPRHKASATSTGTIAPLQKNPPFSASDLSDMINGFSQ